MWDPGCGLWGYESMGRQGWRPCGSAVVAELTKVVTGTPTLGLQALTGRSHVRVTVGCVTCAPRMPLPNRTNQQSNPIQYPLPLRRLYTHVDFVAKRHDSWRFQHPFFAPKKSISFFRPTPRGFSSWDTTTSPFVALRAAHIHPRFRAWNLSI